MPSGWSEPPESPQGAGRPTFAPIACAPQPNNTARLPQPSRSQRLNARPNRTLLHVQQWQPVQPTISEALHTIVEATPDRIGQKPIQHASSGDTSRCLFERSCTDLTRSMPNRTRGFATTRRCPVDSPRRFPCLLKASRRKLRRPVELRAARSQRTLRSAKASPRTGSVSAGSNSGWVFAISDRPRPVASRRWPQPADRRRRPASAMASSGCRIWPN